MHASGCIVLAAKYISGARDSRKVTAPIEQAIDALRLTSQACQLFQLQPATEQRQLLQVLIQLAAWKEGTLHTKLFERF